MSSKAKQQNYRRLMKEAKGKSSSQQKKIDHPLARYNALDQLSCIVCQQVVKSELLWGTHLKSKRHKETMVELKNRKEALQQKTTSSGIGRDRAKGDRSEVEPAADPPKPPALKKSETETEAGGNDVIKGDDVIKDEPPPKKQKVIIDAAEEKKIQTSLPADFFDAGVSKRFGEDGDSDDGREMVKGDSERVKSDNKKSMSSTEDLKAESASSSSTDDKDGGKAALPEGFFDDPKMDAKARKVEYRDKMEDEWEKFQKTIQKENDISEAIQFEEDEETQGDRDMTEVQEQVGCFQKAEALRLKQEDLLEKRSKGVHGEEGTREGRGGRSGGEMLSEVSKDGSSEEDSDADDDELEMDWRAKQS